MGSLVVVTGCGTGIGKTHTAEALVRRLAETGRVGSYKPIETGVPAGADEGEDSRRLGSAALFHVKQRYAFAPPISPHLAAEQAGVAIDPGAIADDVRIARRDTDALVVELAGGLFSPLSLSATNADLVARLHPDLHLLVAANRLGVLHEVLAVARSGVTIDAVVLTADTTTDESQDSNARELRRLGVRCLGTLPRAPSSTLASDPILTELTELLQASAGPPSLRPPAK